MKRFSSLALIAAFGLSLAFSSTGQSKDADAEYDVLCKNEWAKTTADIPAPFSDWITILCMPDGQRLAAAPDEAQTIWLDHKTKKPFLLSAFPPLQTKDKDALEKLGPDGLRFKNFVGKKAGPQNHSFALKLFRDKFSTLSTNEIDAIYHLEAHSTWNNESYILFFYVKDEAPTHLITCAYGCKLSVSVDITTMEKFKNGYASARRTPI